MHVNMPSVEPDILCACKREKEKDLTKIGQPGDFEIFHESRLVNKIQHELFQGKRCINSSPNAVHYCPKTLKNLPLNLNITTFLNNIPKPRSTNTP